MDQKPKVTLFYCINSFSEEDLLLFEKCFEIKVVKMACSSMVKDVFLLRGFEAGADLVVVLVCPEGQCQYVEGNLRAKKRIGWVKNLLDEIGIDKRRLAIFNLSVNDKASLEHIVRKIQNDIEKVGLNQVA